MAKIRTGTARERRRYALFAVGGKAVARLFPEVAAALAKQGADRPIYLCPLCQNGFDRGALDDKRLTLEHVPPRALGGKELVLTCRDCNAHSGKHLDHHMLKADRPIAFLRGEHPGGQLVNLKLPNGPSITVRVGGGGESIVMMGKEGVDPPKQRQAFMTTMNEIVDSKSLAWSFNIDFKEDRHDPQLAAVGWLRAAYLAAFARFGYRYAFGRALQGVRYQIANPKEKTLPHQFRVLDPTASIDTRRIAVLEQPKAAAGVFVQMRWHMIFLPHPGDEAFYDRLKNQTGHFQGGGTFVDWPKTAEHSGDGLAEPSPRRRPQPRKKASRAAKSAPRTQSKKNKAAG